jgi:hypothetical protein
VAADAEQALLQFPVGRQLAGRGAAVDAAIHHDGHRLRHRAGDADVLLDHQHVDLAILGERDEQLLQLRHDHRREAPPSARP